MSKSIQEKIELFNKKNQSDKNIPLKEKNNIDNNPKILKKTNEKVNVNKNTEKKISSPSNNNNNTNNTSNTKKEKEDTNERKRKETVLVHFKPSFNPKASEKKITSDTNTPSKNEDINKSEKKPNTQKVIESNESIKKDNIPKVDLTEFKKEKESMIKLQIINDLSNFNEEDFLKRRYDKSNVEDAGKKFFKLRYLKHKLNSNNIKTEKEKSEINKEQNEESHSNADKERILRKYNSEFILTVEKSILSFNVKNFKDSYEVLKESDIIKDVKEYGEFLLVVSGFDKFLMGEFLAKQKYPNDNKEVLNNFIESINMRMIEISFLDCLRFLFTRLILPKDANLILEIMDKFSVNFFEVNKIDPDFVETFKSSDKIYLLVSTILALNTMFTRKDIKIKNVIKKDEFIKMNIDIKKDYIEKLYDELKKNPISMTDDYNELNYKKLASLVGVNSENKAEEKSGKDLKINLGTRNSNIILEEKSEDNLINNNNNKINEKLIKNINVLDEIEEEEDYNMKTNLDNLKEEDKIILNNPQKLYKIKGNKKSVQKDYIFSEDFSKIYYLQKPKKFLYVDKLKEVYNGSEHSHNIDIIKYLKSNPSEEQFKSNFISLVFENKQIDFMSDSLDSVLKWYKAIKNLIALYGIKNKNIRSEGIENKFENEIKETMINIWEVLLHKWNIYGIYLITKLAERNDITKDNNNNVLETSKKLANKNIKNFLKTIETKLNKDKDIDYSDFINIYYIGLPPSIRKSIWKYLIGNPCGIRHTTYEQIIKKIPIIDFKSFDLDKSSDKNYSSDNISNKIIKEIIDVNDIFLEEEMNKNMDKIETMNKVYNIARSFWIFRPDIPFNKSLITIIYFFLFVFENESETFSNIVNLICSNILDIFIGEENEIKIYSDFFNYLLEKYNPKISMHFQKLEITPEFYIIPWFEELFTKTLNINILYHIFDLFLLNGEYILFQTSLSIIKSLEDELLNLTINEIFKILQRFPDNISETNFMFTLNGFTDIKKEVSDWKSQNYLAKQKSDLFEIFFQVN